MDVISLSSPIRFYVNLEKSYKDREKQLPSWRGAEEASFFIMLWKYLASSWLLGVFKADDRFVERDRTI